MVFKWRKLCDSVIVSAAGRDGLWPASQHGLFHHPSISIALCSGSHYHPDSHHGNVSFWSATCALPTCQTRGGELEGGGQREKKHRENINTRKRDSGVRCRKTLSVVPQQTILTKNIHWSVETTCVSVGISPAGYLPGSLKHLLDQDLNNLIAHLAAWMRHGGVDSWPNISL